MPAEIILASVGRPRATSRTINRRIDSSVWTNTSASQPWKAQRLPMRIGIIDQDWDIKVRRAGRLTTNYQPANHACRAAGKRSTTSARAVTTGSGLLMASIIAGLTNVFASRSAKDDRGAARQARPFGRISAQLTDGLRHARRVAPP